MCWWSTLLPAQISIAFRSSFDRPVLCIPRHSTSLHIRIRIFSFGCQQVNALTAITALHDSIGRNAQHHDRAALMAYSLLLSPPRDNMYTKCNVLDRIRATHEELRETRIYIAAERSQFIPEIHRLVVPTTAIKSTLSEARRYENRS